EWKIREVTADTLKLTFQQLYGFVMAHNRTIGKPRISSLAELVTKESVTGFIKYSLNERQLQGESVRIKLVSVYAALKQRYRDHDFAWFGELLSGIAPSPESERWIRKEATLLPYEVLVNVPDALRKQRTGRAKMDARQLARLVHNELLL